MIHQFVTTENSVYEIDGQQIRQVSGERTTECFAPQGSWHEFESIEQFNPAGGLRIEWARGAPHTHTVTSRVISHRFPHDDYEAQQARGNEP